VLSEECQPGILHSSTMAYFANSLKPTETWTVTDQFFSPYYSCTLSWHSELQNSQVCETTSCTPCSFNFSQSNKCAAIGLSSQPHSCIDYSLTLSGFDCFFASYCNSPGVITMVCGNHIGDFFVTPLCDWNRATVPCYYFTFLFSYITSTFWNIFLFIFSVTTQFILCMAFSILARQGELPKLSIQLSGPVSIQALPASEQ
jgi:hypothetical protein